MLLKGPLARGYRTNLWMTARIAELIEPEFGVHYHRDHIGRLMHSFSWSHQKPETRAIERDEKAIARWKKKDWPREKSGARLGAAHIVFADEPGFLLIPHVAKTWTPRGQTPVIRRRYRRAKISVISGVSVSPKRQRLSFFYQLHFQNIGQEEVCELLRHLLRHLKESVIALLDNSRTHDGQPLQELLRQHPRLRIEHFPPYAPELNPDQ